MQSERQDEQNSVDGIDGPFEELTVAFDRLRMALSGLVTDREDSGLRDLLDMSERVRSSVEGVRHSFQERLLIANRLTASALAALPEAVFVMNAEGGIEIQNVAARRLWDSLSDVALLERLLRQLAEVAFMEDADSVPVSFRETVSFESASGQSRAFLPKVMRLRDSCGEAFAVTIVLEEVTEMQASDSRKSEYVGVVSHELRSPLTSLRMAVSLLLEERLGKLNEKQQEMLDLVRTDLDRTLGVLNELMDVSRLQRGPQREDFEEVDVHEIFEMVCAECRGSISGKQMEIVFEVEEELSRLHGIPHQLRLVMRNLLTNAIRHSDQGGKITMGAHRAQDEGCLAIYVRDEGEGLSPKVRGRLFTQQGGGVSGRGLGLAMAREIVAAHDGSLECQSRAGEGATFTVVLPSVEAPENSDCSVSETGDGTCAEVESERVPDA